MSERELSLEKALVDERTTKELYSHLVEVDVDESSLDEEEKEQLDKMLYRIYNIFFPIIHVTDYIDTTTEDLDTVCEKVDNFVEALSKRYHDQDEDVDAPTQGMIGLVCFKRLNRVDENFDYQHAYEYWQNNSKLLLMWSELAE